MVKISQVLQTLDNLLHVDLSSNVTRIEYLFGSEILTVSRQLAQHRGGKDKSARAALSIIGSTVALEAFLNAQLLADLNEQDLVKIQNKKDLPFSSLRIKQKLNIVCRGRVFDSRGKETLKFLLDLIGVR